MEDLFGESQLAFQNQDMCNQQMLMMQQQMLMQQQMMMQEHGMYGQQMYSNPVGTVGRYGIVKYTKQEYLEGLRNYIIRSCNFQVVITKEEKIEDTPQRLRHCCAESKSKIVMLDMLMFSVPETGMNIPFYFCRDCGKLFYYKDFMM